MKNDGFCRCSGDLPKKLISHGIKSKDVPPPPPEPGQVLGGNHTRNPHRKLITGEASEGMLAGCRARFAGSEGAERGLR